MADLPRVPRRLALTQEPGSTVSGADIATPYRILGEAMGEIGEKVETAYLPQAEARGSRSVTRGPDGKLTVQQRPEWSRTDQAFNRGARVAFLAELGPEVTKNLADIRRQNEGNLDAMRTAFDAYGDQLVSNQIPELAPAVKQLVASETERYARGAETDFYNKQTRSQLTAIETELTRKGDEMAVLARAAGTDTDDYRTIQEEYYDLAREVLNDPRYGVPPEKIEAMIAQAEGLGVAEALIGVISRRKPDRGGPSGDLVSRITGAESGGDATAQNPNSTATGPGQFIESTWEAFIRDRHPELAAQGDIQKHRVDRALSDEAVQWYADQNADYLGTRGHAATDGNLYLAHFAGPEGAVKLLEADPTATAESILGSAVVKANPFLQDMSAGDVVAWARGKMGASADDAATLIEDTLWDPNLSLSMEDRRRYVGYAYSELNKMDAEEKRISGVVAERHERRIIDAASENGPLPPRSDIESDPTLQESQRNTLLRSYDTAAKEIIETARFYDRFLSGDAISAFDSDDRANLDKVYKKLGADGPALKMVVDQTGLVPSTVVKSLRGEMVSTDPARVGAALQISSILTAANPHAFAGHDGATDIEKSTASFRHYVDNLGYSADEAAAKIALENTPEHEASVTAKVKGQDINEIVKKNLRLEDLGTAFDTSPGGLGINPDVGFTGNQQAAMFSDYAELFRDRYVENGDVARSKALAQDQLKRIWGVTTVNGSSVVMRYPPDGAPGMAGIEDAGSLIAEQAIEAIKSEADVDVARDQLIFMPLSTTGGEYKSGQPPRYMLGWFDEDSVAHWPGRDFVVDAAQIRTRQTETRAQQFVGEQDRRALPDPTVQPQGIPALIPNPTRGVRP